MTAYVALGKIGDILSVLPILSEEKRITGERQNLIIAKQYAWIFDELSYLKVIPYDGHWQDLKGAMVWAKQKFATVKCLSIYGKDFPFQHKTPSFLMEPWERVGMLAKFDTLPLIIDNRNFTREAILLEQLPELPFILYADHGESSPFTPKEDLYDLLRAILPKEVSIVRLSEIRADNFLDFIGVYDKASMLVSTETAHLHLSAAVPFPVIAFTQDNPSRWHGTPHLKRFSLTCRYSDFDRRRHEIIEALQDPFGCQKTPGVTLSTTQRFAYNPTHMEGLPGMVYRYHPDRSWRTKLEYQHKDGACRVEFPEQFDGMSMEDPRLFMFNGKPHLSFVAARQEFGHTNAVTGYGEFLFSNGRARLEKVFVPEFGMNNWGGIEKNWLFFEHGGKLMCIYASEAQQTVLEVEGARVRAIYRSEAKDWPWGLIRGGAIIPWKGRLLRFFHSHSTTGAREKWVYNIGAVTMEAKPPFQMLQISKSPIVAGDEQMNLYCRHWKQNVVFPAGVKVDSDYFMLAYGYNDCECRLAVMKERDLNL